MELKLDLEMSAKTEINKKRHLEMVLESIPPHKTPKAYLEQYKTPSYIAADLLWNADSLEDIRDKKVIDLGCGTGIFSIGAALLGARQVEGVDIDADAIKIAMEQASRYNLEDVTQFIREDVNSFHGNGDTVIQNPPFGAQKSGIKNADRSFIEKALYTAPVIYSFHKKETEDFVQRYFGSMGGSVTHKFYYSFQIPRIYHFHKKDKVKIDVVVFRVELI